MLKYCKTMHMLNLPQIMLFFSMMGAPANTNIDIFI